MEYDCKPAPWELLVGFTKLIARGAACGCPQHFLAVVVHPVDADQPPSTARAGAARRGSARCLIMQATGSALNGPLRARVTQTIMQAPHGNALAACAASILGVNLDDTPNFVKEPDYLAAMQAHAARHGCSLRKLALEDGRLPTSEALAPGSLCIARGTSPRGHGHVIVACVAADGLSLEFVHDPFPSGGFLDGHAVWAAIYFVATNRMPSDAPISLTVLPPERIDDAAALTAAAFAGRPNVWRAVCGATTPADMQRHFLGWLFARNLWLRRESGCNRVVMVDGKLVCSFMFVPPEVPDVSFCDMVRAGLLKLPLLFGLGPLKRLLKAKSLEEGELKELGGFRLERMVVLPSMQGRGIGSRALQIAFAEADAAGRPVVLSTNEERNVAFYSRFGFEVTSSTTRAIDGESYRVWTMARLPARAASRK